jgi:hypothetical protein
MMPDAPLSLFISYSRTDSAFVDRLEADLKACNFYIWVDRRKLEGGQDWMDELQNAIDRCHVLLVVLSPEAMASKYVRREYRYADQQGKLIIPLNLRPTKVPIDLNGLQWVDFQRGYNQGLYDLQIALSRHEFEVLLPAKPHTVSIDAISISEPVQYQKKPKVEHSTLQGLFPIFMRRRGSRPNSLIENDGIAPLGEVTPKTTGQESKAGWTNLDERYPSKNGSSSKSLLEFYIGKLVAYGNKNRNLAHRANTSAQDARAYEEAAKLLYQYAGLLRPVLGQQTKKMTETVLKVWDDAEKYERRAKEQNNQILEDAVIVILAEFRQTWRWARMGTKPGPMLNA